MKFTFFKNSLIVINIITLLAQLILMGSLGSFFDFPLLTLLVPLICVFNLIFFLIWVVRMQWPFMLFIGAFLIGISEWGLLFQFPNNAIYTSKGLKVMSFNVRLFNTYNWIDRDDIPQAIEEFIAQEAPDVICFQEYEQKGAPEFLGYPYRYFQSTASNRSIGSAILSKKPLYNSGNIQFKKSTNGGIYVDIKYKKDTLRIYNVHFESLKINIRDTLITNQNSSVLKNRIREVLKKQNDQVRLFRGVASQNTHPSILCTDLNNNAFSKVYSSLSKGQNDAFVTAGSGMGTSYHFSYFPLRIDFIFTDPRIKIYSFKSYSLEFSDHEPLTVEVNWP